jgi:multisubunit Na+/H+ antiporter MnhB subunit
MATLVGLFWVVVHILGMVIAAIALRRARILPLWAAILLGLSQPVHLVAAIIVPSRWLDVFGGWGMTTLICGYVALQLLRTRNEDWDLPRLPA